MRIADPRDVVGDVATCLIFYTRLPLPRINMEGGSFASAQWAAPVAGLAIAAVGWLVGWLSFKLGVSAGVGAALTLGAVLLVTGCLHEDGLADTADGFGGGKTRERKLEIMRDSRIGTFGATALVMSLLVRCAALSALASPTAAFFSLVAAHAASRALIPAFLQSTPSARPDGLAAGVGAVPRNAAGAAAGLGLLALLPLGFWTAVLAALLLVVWLMAWRALAMRQIGGQTGDVIGALQQGGEILVLVIASAVFTSV